MGEAEEIWRRLKEGHGEVVCVFVCVCVCVCVYVLVGGIEEEQVKPGEAEPIQLLVSEDFGQGCVEGWDSARPRLRPLL
jgi:hypothetical protein